MAKVYLLEDRLEGKVGNMTIFDIAKAFLAMESMPHKKLQKLCYYAQAWHLALYRSRLIPSAFEAWIHGPVCPALYQQYKDWGWALIPQEANMPSTISSEKIAFIEAVYNSYGPLDGDQLEALTHSEQPWMEAREGLEPLEPSNNVLNEETMTEYYRAIYERTQND